MGTRKQVQVVALAILIFVVVSVIRATSHSGNLGKYVGDLNGNLDYAAVVRIDDATRLILEEGSYYLVVDEPDESGFWTLINGTGKNVRWTMCARGSLNSGTGEVQRPIVFLNYLPPVLNGSQLYERNVSWGNPVKVILIRKPGIPPYRNVTVNDSEYGPQTLEIPVNDWIKANLTFSGGRLREAVIVSRHPDHFNLSQKLVRVRIKIVYRGEDGYASLRERVLERYGELMDLCSSGRR